MSTYREIHGKAIKSVSTDPSATTDEGQIWYNTNSETFKSILNLDAFTSSANLSTGRFSSAGAGSQTASLIAGGYSTAATDITEEYNGTGWATGGTLNQARYYIGGAGTQTAALAMSGRHPPAGWALANTEEYNGSAWTNTTAVPTALNQVTTTGTQTAGLLWGGVASPGAAHASTTFELNSESWTAGGSLPAGLKVAGAFGTQTAAMSAGNETGSTLYYNGASWSDQSATVPYSGADYWNYAGTSGTQTAGILMGGGPAAVTTTAKWDGSTWSSNPAMAIARLTGPMRPIGTSTAGLIASGAAPGPVYTTATEEFNSSVNAITVAAWASATASTTTRYIASGVGSNTACVVYGGVLNPGTTLRAQTEEWDGSSWTESGDLATARFGIGQGIGTQTAALAYGGYTTTVVANTEEYNGASWTSATSLPAAGRIQGGFGTQTAGVSAAGQGAPGKWTNSYEYNGASWTSATAYPTAVEQMAGCGTETAGLISGGSADPGLVSTQSHYNGSSWTAGGALLSVLSYQNNNGTQTSCQIIGGGTPSYTTNVSNYDGTSVSTAPSLGTARGYGRGTTTSGAVTGAIITSGSVPGTPSSNTSEEFTTETTAVNVKTLTQS